MSLTQGTTGIPGKESSIKLKEKKKGVETLYYYLHSFVYTVSKEGLYIIHIYHVELNLV